MTILTDVLLLAPGVLGNRGLDEISNVFIEFINMFRSCLLNVTDGTTTLNL